MSVSIEFEDGAAAEARTFEGNVLTFVSPRAFAPGAPVSFATEIGEQRYAFDSRTVGSKRSEEGGFVVRVRLVNLRRAAREALRAALHPRV